MRHTRTGTGECACKKPVEKQIDDEFKTIYCTTCFMVISYEKITTQNNSAKPAPIFTDFESVVDEMRPA